MVALPLALAATGCTKGGGSEGQDVSVLDLGVGRCVVPPGQVHEEIATLKVVPCTQPHTEESYAVATYTGAAAGADEPYPGNPTLKTFADGACAQRYASYVGVDYRDSSLFFTYLLPSPRSWQDDDRSVLCFVTTTGEQLTTSVKGSRR